MRTSDFLSRRVGATSVSDSTARKRRGKGETREALIRCGTELCCERGFQVTGIDEVLKRVGVPKGSFYHHFETKRQFGEAVIDNYAAFFRHRMDKTLGDASRKPLERLRLFVDEARLGIQKYQFQRGCLIGNMGQELGGLDEAFRVRLEEVMLSWQAAVAACLREAVAAGDIAKDVDVEKMAAFFWIGWEGAILRTKLTHSIEPLDLFANLFFELVAAPVRKSGGGRRKPAPAAARRREPSAPAKQGVVASGRASRPRRGSLPPRKPPASSARSR